MEQYIYQTLSMEQYIYLTLVNGTIYLLNSVHGAIYLPTPSLYILCLFVCFGVCLFVFNKRNLHDSRKG